MTESRATGGWSGWMARASGPYPPPKPAPTLLVAVAMGTTPLLLELATYSVFPSGVTASPSVLTPTGMAAPAWFVATVTGVTAWSEVSAT